MDRLLEHAARTVVHYPSYILLVALVPPGRLDLYFWAYAGERALRRPLVLADPRQAGTLLLMSAARPTKVVIVAARMGRRLNPYTDEMPKCLVPVRSLDPFRAHGVTDVVVVRGYKADVLERRKAELGPRVRFVENPDYERNNILQSLFRAETELSGPFLFTCAPLSYASCAYSEALSAACRTASFAWPTRFSTVPSARR